MLGGSASRVSIDSSKVLSNPGWGCFPIESQRQPIGCAPRGLHPHPALSRSPTTLSGSPSSPPVPKAPSSPPYITFYPCPASPLSGAPWTGASNWGLRPEITMLAQCRNGARSQCFSMETQNLVVGQKETMDGPTLKAQSVHQRWRKVCLTNNGVRKLFQQKRCFNWIILSDKYIMSNHYLISAGSS